MVYTTLNLVYSKEHMTMILYDIIVSESFIFFYITYDYVTITVIYDEYMI